MRRTLGFLIVACIAGGAAGAETSGVVGALPAATAVLASQEAQTRDYEALAREIYAEQIALRSTADMPENVMASAVAMQRRLIDAGFSAEDVVIVSPHPELGNVSC